MFLDLFQSQMEKRKTQNEEKYMKEGGLLALKCYSQIQRHIPKSWLTPGENIIYLNFAWKNLYLVFYETLAEITDIFPCSGPPFNVLLNIIGRFFTVFFLYFMWKDNFAQHREQPFAGQNLQQLNPLMQIFLSTVM